MRKLSKIGLVRLCGAILKQPYVVMQHVIRVARDPHARLAAAWFFYLVGLFLTVFYLLSNSAGPSMNIQGCSAHFSEIRLAILFTASPLLVVIMLVTLGESVHWLDARRHDRSYSTRLFWVNGVIGSVLAIVLALLARC